MKHILRALALSLLCGSSLLAQEAPAFQTGDLLEVTQDNVQLKLGSQTLAILPRGQEFTVVAVKEDWVGGKLKFKGRDYQGWIMTRQLRWSPLVWKNLGAVIATNPQGEITYLDLTDSKVTDDAMRQLKGLPALTDLFLSNCAVTDVGLDEIGKLTRLEILVLDGTQVTDKGARSLDRLGKLQTLILTGLPLDEETLNHLRKSLPNCEITH